MPHVTMPPFWPWLTPGYVTTPHVTILMKSYDSAERTSNLKLKIKSSSTRLKLKLVNSLRWTKSK